MELIDDLKISNILWATFSWKIPKQKTIIYPCLVYVCGKHSVFYYFLLKWRDE